MGVAHGMCQAIWWYQKRLGYTEKEEEAVKAWLKPWKQFVCGEAGDLQWGCTDVKQYRRFNEDGSISIAEDEQWDEMLAIGRLLMH
jgi:hypothetical protein